MKLARSWKPAMEKRPDPAPVLTSSAGVNTKPTSTRAKATHART